MTSPQTQPLDRKKVWALYLALLAGLLSVAGVFGLLFFLGNAPMAPELRTTPVPWVVALLGGTSVVMGWAWARPQVPLRPASQTTEGYWQEPVNLGKALLLWVLWEGSGIIGAVGTLVTGSLVTGALTAVALALLLTHSPDFLEGRTS